MHIYTYILNTYGERKGEEAKTRRESILPRNNGRNEVHICMSTELGLRLGQALTYQ